MKQIPEVIEYLEAVLNTFVLDPSDSDFQRGYEAALGDVLEDIQRERTNLLDNLSS